MQRVNNALLTLAELPLLVVDGITHHSPGDTVIEAKTHADEDLTNKVDDHLNALGTKGKSQQDRTAHQTNGSAKGSHFLLTMLFDQLGGKRHEDEHRQIAQHHDHTGQRCCAKVGGKHNGISGTGRLHTQKHSDSSHSTTHSRTVFQERAKGLEEVALLTIFLVQLSILVATDGDILEHKDEGNEAQHAHDQGGEEHPVAQQHFDLVAGQGAENLVAKLICLLGQGVFQEVFRGKGSLCALRDLDLIQKPGSVGGIEGDLVPNQHGQQRHGQDVAHHTADGAEHGQRSSFLIILGNDVEHRTVGNVGHGVGSVPDHIAQNKEDRLHQVAGAGERQKYCRTANQQRNGADEDVGLILTHLVLALVTVDKRTNDRVIDCIPCLHQQQQDGKNAGLHHHKDQPEGLNRSLQGKAHVTAKVAGSVGQLVTHAKLAIAFGIQCGCFLCH